MRKITLAATFALAAVLVSSVASAAVLGFGWDWKIDELPTPARWSLFGHLLPDRYTLFR